METSELIQKEGLRRRYSLRTIGLYQKCIEKFFSKCNKKPRKVTKGDVREFIDYLIEKNKAGGTIHVYLNSLKFFFEQCLGKKMRLDIKYCKRPQKLPVVLSKEEVKKLFDVIDNEKHRLMIKLMYSAGLRVSELLNLKICDLEIDKGYGYVRQGKGRKDRIFVLSGKLKEKIKELISDEELNLEDYLLNSNRNKRYHQRSIQQIIKKAVKRAKICKEVSCHTLRHSFATHLIENGYSVSDVQALLGHKSPETTMIYVHMASPNLIKVKSPLDSL